MGNGTTGDPQVSAKGRWRVVRRSDVVYSLGFGTGAVVLLAVTIRPSNWSDLRLFGPIAAGCFVGVFLANLAWLLSARVSANFNYIFIAGLGTLYELIFLSMGRGSLADWNWLVFASLTTFGVIWITGFWRRWMFWRDMRSEPLLKVTLDTALALVILTIYFSAVTSILVAKREVNPKPPLRSAIFAHVEEHYGWRFADAVPALDIPKTLNWREANTFSDHLSGALALTYKLLVILPVVGLIKLALDARRAST